MVLVRILFKQSTVLKQRPVQSSQLRDFEVQGIPVGTLLVLQSYAIPPDHPDHYKISLSQIKFPIQKGSSSTWFAFGDYVEIVNQSLTRVPTIKEIVAPQGSDTVVKISANKQTVGNQKGFLKLVFNQDTVIKRDAVSSDILDPSAKQDIPAGTELILSTNAPNIYNVVEFPLKASHVRFSLKDLSFQGYSQNWYAFIEHVGIQRV
jgi:hypothetical protein